MENNKKDNKIVFDNICEKCYEPYIFKLSDGKNDFSLGLFKVLECLSFAEDEGSVPKLPNEWWADVQSRYNLDL